ncbi:NAD(P)H-dependent flavin oxidoreductase [Alicyclobacillus dauci]|uniref:Probable nitronate monooxygenase n=1 Tax=Alicyclobacillus dauci TaxID=1475485 RepID=A0ABY6Z0P5_9BACL|nr:nitronate monooxygenase [Alicyclobacillus dauci]WAH36108.1 nitronate monooxygenase [Alicyclobacillus dauci]
MSSMRNLARQLNMTYPIIQAGMAGGITTPDLVAAVSEGGGLGTIGAGYLSPTQLKQAIEQVRAKTKKPFGVNLFVPHDYTVQPDSIRHMNEYLNRYRRELGMDAVSSLPTEYAPDFDEQFDVILAEHIPIFSFTFGLLAKEQIAKLHAIGTFVIGTATSVGEAMALEQLGVDAIVAQGSEAGGHRGGFEGQNSGFLVGTMALVPQIADNVSIPVIASGGIMDGRGLAAAMALGAAAVQMGTAFLTCPEAGTNPSYRQALLNHTEEDTRITTAYSGKPARGIETSFVKEMDQYVGSIPDYPVQNALTRDIRQAESLLSCKLATNDGETT